MSYPLAKETGIEQIQALYHFGQNTGNGEDDNTHGMHCRTSFFASFSVNIPLLFLRSCRG